MIQVPMPFQRKVRSNDLIIDESLCDEFFDKNSYKRNMFISSNCFKEIEVGENTLSQRTHDGSNGEEKIQTYRVRILFKKGSDLVHSDWHKDEMSSRKLDQISYHFPCSEVGIETAHQLVDSIMTQING